MIDDDDRNRRLTEEDIQAENRRKPGKSRKAKSPKPDRTRQKQKKQQQEQRKAWNEAWREFTNRLWSSEFWPRDDDKPLIPASERADYHLDALARRSGRFRMTDQEWRLRCGIADTPLYVVRRARLKAIKRGFYRWGDPAKNEKKYWLYRVERDYRKFERQRQEQAGAAAAMLRLILLGCEARAGQGKDPELFLSDGDFAKQIGERSDRAVRSARPVLQKLGVEIRRQHGRGHKTHYRLTGAPRLTDYAVGEPKSNEDYYARGAPPGQPSPGRTGPAPSPAAKPDGNGPIAPPRTKVTRADLQDLAHRFAEPPEEELPAFRRLVADLPGDDELLPFGMAILIPAIAAQLDLVRGQGRQWRDETFKRLLEDYDPDHPERLAQLGWIQTLRRAIDQQW